MTVKINGYTKEEAQNFIKFICYGKENGKTLSCLFGEYANATNRARGSVRNYYYNLLKSSDDAEVQKLLEGKNLKAGEIKAFTPQETDEILSAILRQKCKGVSVRRAVCNLADGDKKLMLRYQNKYRNTLVKEPERIENLLKSCGITEPDYAIKQVEEQINGLYDRLAASLREENIRLNVVIKRLTDENKLLKHKLKNLQK